jgi:hypothetical protein
MARGQIQAGRCRNGGFRSVHRQWQIGIDFTEKKPRAVLPVQQQGVLAAPAQPGFRGEFHFQHRRAVGEDAKMVFADFRADFFGQALQPVAQHLVIIASQRVAET